MGGAILHKGKIAEMKTGEGKTLVATLPIYLNALLGRGGHLVTVNDYLSRRDAGWMAPIYHALGLSVAAIGHEFSGIYDPAYDDPHPHHDDRLNHFRPVTRREAYHADVTYGTNNEFGFDYLRDNMVLRVEDVVLGDLYYAIVDEVDFILIDEARTPLIISGMVEAPTERYKQFAQIVRRLTPGADYTVEEKIKNATLTEEGVTKVERILGIGNISDPEHVDLMHHIQQAVRAHACYKKDVDYVVKDGQVIIVDEFTGRLMFGRRYSDGLHQAIEAQEGCEGGAGEPDARDHHLPELLPHVPEAGRHDRHGQDRGRGTAEDLQPPGRRHPHAQADDPPGSPRRDLQERAGQVEGGRGGDRGVA